MQQHCGTGLTRRGFLGTGAAACVVSSTQAIELQAGRPPLRIVQVGTGDRGIVFHRPDCAYFTAEEGENGAAA